MLAIWSKRVASASTQQRKNVSIFDGVHRNCHPRAADSRRLLSSSNPEAATPYSPRKIVPGTSPRPRTSSRQVHHQERLGKRLVGGTSEGLGERWKDADVPGSDGIEGEVRYCSQRHACESSTYIAFTICSDRWIVITDPIRERSCETGP